MIPTAYGYRLYTGTGPDVAFQAVHQMQSGKPNRGDGRQMNTEKTGVCIWRDELCNLLAFYLILLLSVLL